MVRIFLCFMLLINISIPVFARSVINQYPTQYPYHKTYGYYNSSALNNDLSALERYTMRRSYPRENPLQRLERLENLAFGSIQGGDIGTRYKNVETAILSRPSQNYKKSSLINNLANYFAGQATGLSPAITTDRYYAPNAYSNYYPNTYPYNYPQGYGNQRIEHFSNGIFGGGYNLRTNDYGSGSSIRILP